MKKPDKQFIKSLDYEEVSSFFSSVGEKDYRARQLFNWLYERNVTSFDEMTNFSKELRKKLDSLFIVSPLSLEEHRVSPSDGTEKYLFRTFDGHYIESVLLKSEGTDDGRLTVCISSQVGCAMGCVFCATARIGFRRNLETGEILDQLCHVRRLTGLKNNNIVFMGMGEPFMNYDNVIRAAEIMNYSFGFHISVRKITISTCGILGGLERFMHEKQPYNLAISLNDTDPEKRAHSMPVEKKYPFAEIIALLGRTFPVSRNRLTIEYIMRRDNISRDDARRLKKMFKYGRIKLNLIPLNPGSDAFGAPGQEEIDNFVKELEIMNVPISIRKSLGADISGACGQLSGKKYSTE
ncbi:MAG TPA: 23S rRNA (adenine(2503)-C(2))-methyltransferase RlmN [Spirochaetota bacterium]|nr:23S rRNA (adenine(2503)-C(2))-methyltransferase RlmN [Spirochaetota bacterium]HRZ28791.1 23S rRNA (adenine(2503)-C(2))-methyltransferase RlmN [Spirochaetota bacterium]